MNKMKFFSCCFCLLLLVSFISCDDDEERVDTIAQIQENKEKGEKYLKEKSKEEGVKTDPSGLLYREVISSDGVKPGANDTVYFHYDGYIISGKKFISQTEKSAMEDLNEAFYIGLRHMNEGSTFRLYVPYYLMYGATPKTFISSKDTVKVKEYSALYYDMSLDSITFVK